MVWAPICTTTLLANKSTYSQGDPRIQSESLKQGTPCCIFHCRIFQQSVHSLKLCAPSCLWQATGVVLAGLAESDGIASFTGVRLRGLSGSTFNMSFSAFTKYRTLTPLRQVCRLIWETEAAHTGWRVEAWTLDWSWCILIYFLFNVTYQHREPPILETKSIKMEIYNLGWFKKIFRKGTLLSNLMTSRMCVVWLSAKRSSKAHFSVASLLFDMYKGKRVNKAQLHSF